MVIIESSRTAAVAPTPVREPAVRPIIEPQPVTPKVPTPAPNPDSPFRLPPHIDPNETERPKA